MYKQWEIYWIDLNPIKWSEQAGIRPCVVISGNSFNRNWKLIWIMPITCQIKNFPFDIILKKNDYPFLECDSEILVFQLKTISTKRIKTKIWKLSFVILKNILKNINHLIKL